MDSLEFIEDGHLYLCGGVIIPSVSDLVKFQLADMYKGIPERILKKAADFGTSVHGYIEQMYTGKFDAEAFNFNRNIDPNIKMAVRQAAKVMARNGMEVRNMEQMVAYNGRYAGRYDILTKDNQLVDIKTTSKLHVDALEIQLGLYYMALGMNKDIGYCLWLPKGQIGKIVEIKPWNHERCLDLLERYEKCTE